jgi:putative ABC transport system ATP-binding protein
MIKDISTESNHMVICCKHLTKYFMMKHGQVNVLHNIDLSVRAGEIVGISGRSGTGKSTLLQLMAGLERPSSGTVTIKGQALHRLSEAERAELRRSALGFIFQNFNLLPSWNVLENVEAPMMHTRVHRSKRRARAMTLLDRLGLIKQFEHLPAELSVGQQQRVAIARALVNEPSIVLADEPTGDVDPETGDEIIGCLTELVREGGVTLIVATHGVFPKASGDRWLTLCDGKLI